MSSLENLPIPSLDRPFGVQLWPTFARVYTAIMGYAPTDFKFVPAQTPMSTFKETAITLTAYYVIVLGGRELMRNRKPVPVNGAFIVHNFYLTAISAVLLALFVEQLLPTVVRKGVFFTICHREGGWTNQLVILYYLNYLTKYLELLDTFFLVLKKKPLTFLHTYHHGATAALCYSQLIGLTAVSWVPITLNLMVHVVMYWYYFQSARGVRIWWKQYITMLQILQFIIDIGFVYFASYTYFVSTYYPWMPNAGRCAGEEFAAFAGMGILSSYLLLFISFYLATYQKSNAGDRPRRNTGKQAAIEMRNFEIPDGHQHLLSEGTGSDGGILNENGNVKTSSRASGGPSTRSRKA